MLKDSIRNRIGFGAGKLSIMPTLRSALHILETAFDNGITHFDTAPIYGSGYSEKILGKFAKGKREKILIASKVGLYPAVEYNLPASIALPLNYGKRILTKKSSQRMAYNPGIVPYRVISKEFLRKSFEKSLTNLKTEYIDYYLLHEILPEFLAEDALDYLITLKKSGKIEKVGIAASGSNYLNLDNIPNLWSVLQHEHSPYKTSELVHNKFPNKEHIMHSILVNSKMPDNIFPKENRGGYLLAQYLQTHLVEKILFSTAKVKTLLTNIKAINSFT